MSQTLHDSIEKGFATRIASHENGQECTSCKNIFSTGEKVYRINKKDNTTIQCTSLHCFREQGGKIDEYQINTVIGPKPQGTSIVSSVASSTAPITPDAEYESKVMKEFYNIHGIGEILLKNVKSVFDDEDPDKLYTYMKMIDHNISKST